MLSVIATFGAGSAKSSRLSVPTFTKLTENVRHCWKRLYSGPLNVLWFGATGKGGGLPPGNGTDDTAAIQAALNVFSTNGTGGTNSTLPNAIFFPPGVYNISSTLPFHGQIGFALRLMGSICGDGICGVRLLWTGAAGGTLARFAGLNQCFFDHIGFDGNGGGGNGARLALWVDSDQSTGGAGTANVTFQHCMFTGANGAGSTLVQIGCRTRSHTRT